MSPLQRSQHPGAWRAPALQEWRPWVLRETAAGDSMNWANNLHAGCPSPGQGRTPLMQAAAASTKKAPCKEDRVSAAVSGRAALFPILFTVFLNSWRRQ